MVCLCHFKGKWKVILSFNGHQSKQTVFVAKEGPATFLVGYELLGRQDILLSDMVTTD